VRQRTDGDPAPWDDSTIMPPPRPSAPRKKSLVLLFEAARRRLARQPGDIAALPNTRIVTATAEMKRVTEDIRDAQAPPEESTPVPKVQSMLVHTVGKILRWKKIDS
jgi:hypothetical protein